MGGMNVLNDNDAQGVIGLLEGVGGQSIVGGRPRRSGGGCAYFYPPTGGIPAATFNTSNDQLSVGSAVCTKAIVVTTGVYEPGTATETIENTTSFIVGASGRPMICEKNEYGRWVVVVEDCGSSSTGGGGPTPNPDVGDSGSSRGIDMGYSLGV